MCIAIAKPIGAKCPSLSVLRNCWDSNDDGAGFAFNDNGVVVIRKGFMTWDAFESAWLKYSKKYDFTSKGVLIHFRISTSMTVTPENTHPFPLVADTSYLQKPESKADYAVIHNGIISMTAAKARQERTTSDTLVFVRDYLSLIAQNRAWFRRPANIELIEKLIDSKMAILNAAGDIIMTSGFTEDNGVFYSNSTYKIARKRYTSVGTSTYYNGCNYNYTGSGYSDWNNWDEYDDDSSYGLGWGYSQEMSNKNRHSSGYSSAGNSNCTVPLMRCYVHDTIEGDAISDYCHDASERNWALSAEGFLYELVRDETTSSGYGSDKVSDYALSFCGSGKFIDQSNKVRSFVSNFFPKKGQFLAGSYPEEIMSRGYDDDDDGFEDENFADLAQENSDTPDSSEYPANKKTKAERKNSVKKVL